jgi:hypothetical protein
MLVSSFKLKLLLIGSLGSICASSALNSDALAVLGGVQKANAYRAPTARSGRSSTFGGVLEYGKVLDAYKDGCQKTFQNSEEKFCTNWDWLENLVNHRGSTRVRDALVDAGMYLVNKAYKTEDSTLVAARSINLVAFLLRPEFVDGEGLSAWQKKFSEVAGSQEVAVNFFNAVRSNHEEALASEPAKLLQELFFGDGKFEGLASRYDLIRRDDAIRDNTFELFESLFSETVSARSIQLLKAEAAEKDRQIAAEREALKKEREERKVAEEKAAADAARIMSENAEKRKEFEERIIKIEEEHKRLAEQKSVRSEPVKLTVQQGQQQQQKSGIGCAN